MLILAIGVASWVALDSITPKEPGLGPPLMEQSNSSEWLPASSNIYDGITVYYRSDPNSPPWPLYEVIETTRTDDGPKMLVRYPNGQYSELDRRQWAISEEMKAGRILVRAADIPR